MMQALNKMGRVCARSAPGKASSGNMSRFRVGGFARQYSNSVVRRVDTETSESVILSAKTSNYDDINEVGFTDSLKSEENIRMINKQGVSDLVNKVLDLDTVEMAQFNYYVATRLGRTEDDISGHVTLFPGGGGGGGGGSGGGAGAAAPEEAAKEKTAFDLKLESFDPKAKIKIIKEVRAATGLGLKEAKDLVEKAPTVVKEGLTKEDAEKLSKIITDLGGVCSM